MMRIFEKLYLREIIVQILPYGCIFCQLDTSSSEVVLLTEWSSGWYLSHVLLALPQSDSPRCTQTLRAHVRMCHCFLDHFLPVRSCVWYVSPLCITMATDHQNQRGNVIIVVIVRTCQLPLCNFILRLKIILRLTSCWFYTSHMDGVFVYYITFCSSLFIKKVVPLTNNVMLTPALGTYLSYSLAK